ncbi:hypothetical protein, partial [Klebsiella pneumoniae]|uniref:hypothetical protein n=1 Tax=Klebsiella pneumoniae TaxID=573 RepID=UPI00358DE2AE
SSEGYSETAFAHRNRAQKVEEIKDTLIQGIRQESLGRSHNRGTSTERRTLPSPHVEEEAVLIQA